MTTGIIISRWFAWWFDSTADSSAVASSSLPSIIVVVNAEIVGSAIWKEIGENYL